MVDPDITQERPTQVSQINYTYLLFLHPSDTLEALLISLKLTGPENYTLWSRSMALALLGKNKLGLVDGSCPQSLYKGELAKQ